MKKPDPRKTRKQQEVIEKIRHGNLIKIGKKRVTIYKSRKGKMIYQRQWISKRAYTATIRRVSTRTEYKREYRSRKLPQGFRKVDPMATVFGFRQKKGKTDAKEFLAKLKSAGLDVSKTKKRDTIIKTYTEDQKSLLAAIYNDYRDSGHLRQSP